jgi:hypothetical protein
MGLDTSPLWDARCPLLQFHPNPPRQTPPPHPQPSEPAPPPPRSSHACATHRACATSQRVQNTGETTWERPAHFSTPRDAGGGAVAGGGSGEASWVTLWDDVNQCSYYYDQATGATQYEPPMLTGA